MATDTLTEPATTAADPSRRRRISFWIARYLPAEIAGTATLVIAGLWVTMWTDHPVVVAIAAVAGENVGFYGVLAVAVLLEQRRRGLVGRRAIAFTVVLLIAEFGAAELLDTFLIRPTALTLAVWLIPEPTWALLAGKLVADAVFYLIAAGAFTVTDRTGLRRRGGGDPA